MLVLLYMYMVCVYKCACVCMCACVYVYACACVYVHMGKGLCLCMHLCVCMNKIYVHLLAAIYSIMCVLTANNQVNQEVRQQNSTVSKVLSQRVTSGDTDWLTSNRTQNDGNLLNNKSANFKSNREHLDNGMYSKNDSDEWQTWQSPSVGHNGVKTVKSDNDGDPFIDNKTSSGSWMINSKNNSSGMRDIWNF